MASDLPKAIREYIKQERYNNTHSVHIVEDKIYEWIDKFECGWFCDTVNKYREPCGSCRVKHELKEVLNVRNRSNTDSCE